MSQRYLVTGAQGFIGRYLIAHLLDRFPESWLLGLGRSPEQGSTFLHHVSCGDKVVCAPLPESLRIIPSKRYKYLSCELSSPNLVEAIRDFRPTVVIHLAASLRGISKEVVVQNNTHSTEGLLKAIRGSGVKIELFLIASSGGVYGRQEQLPIAETAAVAPVDLYARSKLACEELARSFSLQTGIPVAIARIFNVVGPGQDELHFAGRIAGQVAAILDGRSAPVIRAGLLSSTRDFVDVRDTSFALGSVLERRLEGVCNIASGIETKVGDLLQLFLVSSGLAANVEIRRDEDASDPIPRHVAKIARLSQIGFVPTISLSQTCRDMSSYYPGYVYTDP
jgi:GDP-4-dehydro-6-deoxy-D-mannose reductase